MCQGGPFSSWLSWKTNSRYQNNDFGNVNAILCQMVRFQSRVCSASQIFQISQQTNTFVFTNSDIIRQSKFYLSSTIDSSFGYIMNSSADAHCI